ncbi:MAG: hypothetical protein AAGB11_20315 [Pseudomonadota bacterium]
MIASVSLKLGLAAALFLALAAGVMPTVTSAQAASNGIHTQLAFLDRFRRRGGGKCLDPASVDDRDVRRHSADIAQNRLCVTRERFSEGGIDWRFVIVDSGRRGPVWYMPHDDEDTAFDAALYAISRYGGRLVAVDGPETRTYAGVDPNRHFAQSRREAATCRMRQATPKYTRFVEGLFRGAKRVFSIHNNTRGGGITANVNTAKLTGYRASGPLSDPDHLVFIAGTRPIDQDRKALSLRNKLLGAGLNVVHEQVTRSNNDCSFSNHIALNDGRDYFNLEAVHGSRIQRPMVDALMGVLGYRPR